MENQPTSKGKPAQAPVALFRTVGGGIYPGAAFKSGKERQRANTTFDNADDMNIPAFTDKTAPRAPFKPGSVTGAAWFNIETVFCHACLNPGAMLRSHGLRPDTRAAGWIKALHADGGKLWAWIELTPYGHGLVDSAEFAFFSTEYDYRDFKQTAAGAEPQRLAGCTLTNGPRHPAQTPCTNMKSLQARACATQDNKNMNTEMEEQKTQLIQGEIGGNNCLLNFTLASDAAVEAALAAGASSYTLAVSAQESTIWNVESLSNSNMSFTYGTLSNGGVVYQLDGKYDAAGSVAWNNLDQYLDAQEDAQEISLAAGASYVVIDKNRLISLTVTALEPATAALSLLALIGVAARRRRQA